LVAIGRILQRYLRNRGEAGISLIHHQGAIQKGGGKGGRIWKIASAAKRIRGGLAGAMVRFASTMKKKSVKTPC